MIVIHDRFGYSHVPGSSECSNQADGRSNQADGRSNQADGHSNQAVNQIGKCCRQREMNEHSDGCEDKRVIIRNLLQIPDRDLKSFGIPELSTTFMNALYCKENSRETRCGI